MEVVNRSNLEMVEMEHVKKVLKHQKELILKEIRDNAAQFDADIESLSKERVALESDIKFADIKLLLLYREWMLLKEFEKYDNALADKLVMKRNEKADIDAKIKECQEKLISKKLEIEDVITKEKSIQEEFHKTLGENNKHEEYLTKVFKKKIKRTKVGGGLCVCVKTFRKKLNLMERRKRGIIMMRRRRRRRKMRRIMMMTMEVMDRIRCRVMERGWRRGMSE
ncbi:hypothetical protein BC829DRAFT_276544 [Chytridium lagenaria]|nr:hypothetical protein BC829DRAFT_276544 [Chytridium lagenaria]